ncbi:hypothetical protein ACTGVN_11045, partial [Streptococcus suis]
MFIVRHRRPLAASVSAFAMALIAVSPVAAQTASGAQTSTAEDQDAGDTIVVTGSRIDRAGYDAPTPTIRVTEQDLSIGGRTT